jgi:hypothetical protein
MPTSARLGSFILKSITRFGIFLVFGFFITVALHVRRILNVTTYGQVRILSPPFNFLLPIAEADTNTVVLKAKAVLILVAFSPVSLLNTLKGAN